MANSQQTQPRTASVPDALKIPTPVDDIILDAPKVVASPVTASTSDNEVMAAYNAQRKLVKEYKENLAEEQAEREKIEMARQQIENWRKSEAMTLNAQAGCSHLKEDGRRLNIVGQKDHSGRMIDICQRCHKVWNGAIGEFLPQHLANYPRGNETVGMIH